MVRVHPDRPVNREVSDVFIENRIKKRNELKRTDIEDIKLTRSIGFKVFPISRVITTISPMREIAWWKIQQEGSIRKYEAFSLSNQNNVCKVKLRQFKENSKKPNSGNTEKEVQATKSIR